MVGEFGPILADVRKKTDSIYVFEQDVSGDSSLYPSDAIPQHLPKCDVVVVTATSLINHTLDTVLSCCRDARQVCLVGPSTPLCPEVLGQYNVHLLAGSVVTEPALILETVQPGRRHHGDEAGAPAGACQGLTVVWERFIDGAYPTWVMIPAAVPRRTRKTGCLVCGAELVCSPDMSFNAECYYCGRTESTSFFCLEGHYVCKRLP